MTGQPHMPERPADWSPILREEWEQRAKSPHRDYYVASHRGDRNSAAWARQARIDAALALHGLSSETLASSDVLEIGCGIGRLVPHVAPLVSTYTGIDIAPSMIADAAATHAGQDNVRFAVSDGVDLPASAKDRRYDVVIAVAVF